MPQPNPDPSLFVVLPVFNEQAALRQVIEEWTVVLRNTSPGFTLYAINDGSSDASLTILLELSAEIPELEILNQANLGHGRSCLNAYLTAVRRGSEWVLQIDSDGQCDPQYFTKFWSERRHESPTYGQRCSRADGIHRQLLSYGLRLLIRVATGIEVRDSNVPYRLMHNSTLKRCLSFIPIDTPLPNVLLAVLHQYWFNIRWVTIHFRARQGGQSFHKFFLLIVLTVRLYQALRRCFNSISKNL